MLELLNSLFKSLPRADDLPFPKITPSGLSMGTITNMAFFSKISSFFLRHNSLINEDTMIEPLD